MMEVEHRRVVEEEEEEEQQLQSRRRRPDSGSDDSISNENSSKVTLSNGDHHEEVDKKGISEKSVYFDKDEETRIQWSLSGKNIVSEDVKIPELVNAIINNPNEGHLDNEIVSGFVASTHVGSEENVRLDLVDADSDEEVLELEFETAAQKVHTHTPYCPNCSSRITKVVLRRKIRRDTRAHRPVDLLGCLKCFSIFIPSGNCLNPFSLFGSKGKQQVPKVVGDKITSDQTNLPVSQGGSTSTTTYIKQGGDESDLLRKRENVGGGQESLGSDEEGKRKEVSIKIPGRFRVTAPPHPSSSSGDHVEIDIVDGLTGGIKGGMKPPTAPVGEEKPGELVGQNEASVSEAPVVPSGDHGFRSLEILKCIVYGGLVELIASLSIVSSAASSDTATANIIAIGVATLISGLTIFGQNLMDMKNAVSVDKYEESLGTRGHFPLHASFATLSYLVFGLIPPLTYGFTFRESDDKDYKILAVGIASLACVFLLAISKAYVGRSDKWSDYVKTIMYYMTVAVSASGVSYAAGDLIKMEMENLGWFEPTQPANFFKPNMMVSSPPGFASF